MPSSSDPSLILLLGLGESQATATRVNSGSLGSAHDFLPETDTAKPGEGVPSASDGAGGRCAVISQAPEGGLYTTEWRRLIGKIEANNAPHSARPAMPLASANDDWAFGVRFRWVTPYTEGISDEDYNVVFGYGPETNTIPSMSICFRAQDDTDETLGARLWLNTPESGATGLEVEGTTNWTATGSPASYYIDPDVWYRVIVRVIYDGSTGTTYKVYLVNEETGTLYTFTYTGSSETSDWAGSSDSAWMVGAAFDGSGSSAYTTAFAHVTEAWVYDGALSDDEATSIVYGGFTIAYTPPSYRVADHATHAAVSRESDAYPLLRPLPIGGEYARYPAEVHCDRVRVRVAGWRPGRPWLLRKIEGMFDTQGPWSSKSGNPFRFDDLTMGLHRYGGILPPGAWEDGQDVETTRLGPRRRRGFKIRRNVATDQGDDSTNGFFFFRTTDAALYGIYKVGTKLYEETGGAASVLDSGWNPQQLPCFMFLDNRAIILTSARRKTYDGQPATISSFGVDAPASIAAATGIGGTLVGDFYYAATLYDPTTGDESAPVVTTSVVSPSTQKVTLTLPASSPDARFTKYRIYRTVDGGTAPNFFLLDTITVAASYDDTGATALTATQLGQVSTSEDTFLAYITGSPPDTFAHGCVHMERAFYSGGGTYPERIYPSEANDPMRWFPDFWIECEGPVRLLVSWGQRLVAFTDDTIEFLESDWVRDADGDVFYQRTVISRTVGGYGHAAGQVIEGNLWWVDRRAVWTFRGSQPVPVSPPIRDLFPFINSALGSKIVLRFNHLRRQLWLSCANADLQDDSSRFQTVFVLDLDAYQGGKIRWSRYKLDCTMHGDFDDDGAGLQYGLIDHLGVFKQAETYEGDGAEGNEGFTTEDEGTDDFAGSPAGISSISGNVVTVTGSPGWTAGALRGMAVLLYDRSTGVRYWHPISDNTTGTFTVVGAPSANLAAGDGYFIGGIDGRVDFAEQDLASPNEKVIRQIRFSFADLTQTSLYR